MNTEAHRLKRTSPSLFLNSKKDWNHVWPMSTKKSLRKWTLISLEAIIAVAATLAFRYWLAPHDMFGLEAQFPWLWILPTLFALRYGTAVGFGSTLLIFFTWLIHQNFAGGLQELSSFPKEYFIGGVILNLIAGQFSNVWSTRLQRMSVANDYANERLETLTRKHYLLRLSHERLEQELLVKPSTLREALLRLRKLCTAENRTNFSTLPGAIEFMQLLAENCQLEVAAIYFMREGTLTPKLVASLGNSKNLDMNDSLVKYCIMQKSMVHIQTESTWVEIRNSSKYLICAPIVSSTEEIIGLLTVERMPFFALNKKTLEFLSVLTGYYADGIARHSVAYPILDEMPECPHDIALDIIRLHRIYTETKIESSLVAIVFGFDAPAIDKVAQIKRIKRTVDLMWETKSPKGRVLITVLPLAGKAAVEGYLLRINRSLNSSLGQSFTDGHIAAHSVCIGEAQPLFTLRELLGRCG